MTSLPPAARPTTTVRRRLGELLVEQGTITEAELEGALARQRETGRRLGEVLLQERLLRPAQLLRALAGQFGLEFVDLDEVDLDLDVAQSVPAALAARHRAVPYRRDGHRVRVAMANPVDVLALDDLRSVLGAEVVPAMADPDQIHAVLARLGHRDGQVQAAMRLAAADGQAAQVAAEGPPSRADDLDDAPIVRFVDLLIGQALQERATDIHIEPSSNGLRVRFRIDGDLRDAVHPPKHLQPGLISRIKVMADLDIAERRLPQDGHLTAWNAGRPVDVRVATLPTVHGESSVLRLLSSTDNLQTTEDLSFHPEQLVRFQDAFRRPWGAVLVTGPTGSGKTTTLYAALRELNGDTRNVLTIEDPVEYRLDGIKQVQVNPKAGLTFARALRAFLRADPDVILVGEIRDVETATIAIEASLTGHLVLSTLHTNDAASTPLRLLEMGVEPFLVTSALHCVEAQRLVRRLCTRCRRPIDVPAERLVAAGLPERFLTTDVAQVWQAAGCDACSRTGYRGRLAVQEVMSIDEEVAGLVLDRARVEDLQAAAVAKGMLPMRVDGLLKALDGQTTVDEVLRVLV